ncbi:hypothetical protein HF673_05640 [Acidithiobacillus thiooxidans]|uniref:Lipoprotein n=1 Tax=Acidithiobacillus thiooxidans TaxID=930 RepID=A0A1C2J0J7_ACITH|nr:YajG family lipoprotein [Acidithiobacillus thiooxidans]MBU2835282.1 hypothetical protein [Acidithiobacillus thiooxidans]OCX71416.1 hypothetical protein A6M23_11865 [Acidithiobacillus thiooxidans]OCX81781.1 hypothetical protein A6P08_13270 [Acidithiobacillus thiooxidans]
MNTNIKTAAKLAAFAGAFALTGCAFVPYDVHPTYNPPANVVKVPGADKVVVDVDVKDEKKHRKQVSYVVDAYGIETATVSMHVSRDFKSAIESALKARGYNVSPSGDSKLVVVVKKFFFEPIAGILTGSEKGSAVLLVSVINAKGHKIYSTEVDQNYKESGLFLEDHGETARRLMNDSINKLFSNRHFITALSAVKDVSIKK